MYFTERSEYFGKVSLLDPYSVVSDHDLQEFFFAIEVHLHINLVHSEAQSIGDQILEDLLKPHLVAIHFEGQVVSPLNFQTHQVSFSLLSIAFNDFVNRLGKYEISIINLKLVLLQTVDVQVVVHVGSHDYQGRVDLIERLLVSLVSLGPEIFPQNVCSLLNGVDWRFHVLRQ